MSVTDNITRLRHILEACQKIMAFTDNESRDSLEADEKLQLSLVRLVEIIGEAASRTSHDFRQKYDQIPWAAIIGMRNRLVHAYFDVDLDVVWDTVIIAIPELYNQVQAVLVQEDESNDSDSDN
ncbi:MAG: hypothetical protein CL610_00530 [Anaerolineaceae bacterium]|nr:hypothetical protein [Anaerolineaceae bacterium]